MVSGRGDGIGHRMKKKMIQKKETEKKEKTSQNAQGRRPFLQWLWLGLGGLAVVEFILIGLSFLKPGKNKDAQVDLDKILEAGPIDDFKPGTVTPFVQGRFYLVCHENGGFLALSSTCTHLGCSLPWNEEEKQFICPCHSSKFDITGDVISTPAPRALDQFKVELVNGKVHVNLGLRTQRQRFHRDQLIFPESISSKPGRG